MQRIQGPESAAVAILLILRGGRSLRRMLDVALKLVQENLDELFGLNAVGGQQAEVCLWRRTASQDLAA